jgi:hypothetical protein
MDWDCPNDNLPPGVSQAMLDRLYGPDEPDPNEGRTCGECVNASPFEVDIDGFGDITADALVRASSRAYVCDCHPFCYRKESPPYVVIVSDTCGACDEFREDIW